MNQLIDFEEISIKFKSLINEISIPIKLNSSYLLIRIKSIYLSYPLEEISTDGLISRGMFALNNQDNNVHSELFEFNEERYIRHLRTSQIDSNINTALDRDEFFLVYQPQFKSNGIDLLGYESLIRWNSKDFGIISPAEFIPQAEKNGTIHKIGKFVIQNVCVFINDFYQLHGFYPKVSVNVSFVELINPNFAVDFKNILLDYEIETKLIVIEITETAFSDMIDIVLGNINILRAFGFEIHLDDFGTGYSSLNHMSKLAVEVIKLDKSFIDDIVFNYTARGMVQGIIELAHRIGMKVIAEGVESLEQFQVLSELECDYYQGFYFSKPLNVETILSLHTPNENLLKG